MVCQTILSKPTCAVLLDGQAFGLAIGVSNRIVVRHDITSRAGCAPALWCAGAGVWEGRLPWPDRHPLTVAAWDLCEVQWASAIQGCQTLAGKRKTLAGSSV
jgi:hypothetical protein